MLGGDGDGRNDAGRIARVDAGQFDMLHDRRDKGIRPVGNGVGLGLDRVVEKLVDQDRPLGGKGHGRFHVAGQHHLVHDDFHAAPAQHIGGTHHQWITDIRGNRPGFRQTAGHSRGRLGDAQLAHDHAKPVTIFRQVDGVRLGSQDANARLGQLVGDIEWCLSAELHHYSFGFFFLVNA